MLKLVSFLDAITERVGRATSWISLLLVLLVVYDVVMRYFFQQSTAAVIELEWHLFSLIFLLGASYGMKHDKHVRVDVLYMRWSPRRQAWINLMGHLLFVLPFGAILLRSAWKFAANSYAIQETSPNPDGLALWYPIKGAIVVAAALLLLQSLAELLRQALRLAGRMSYPETPEAHA